MTSMATLRTPGQKLLPIPASEQFIEELDSGVRECGYASRAQFIRDAIRDKLVAMGRPMPRELALAPSRLGKGGKRRLPLPRAPKGKAKAKAKAKPGKAKARK